MMTRSFTLIVVESVDGAVADDDGGEENQRWGCPEKRRGQKAVPLLLRLMVLLDMTAAGDGNLIGKEKILVRDER